MKESEIRPQQMFNDYLATARRDAETLFTDRSRWVRVPCVACGGNESSAAFVKIGFPYRQCDDCGTVFVNPRPEAALLDNFYQKGESVGFYSDRFYRETEEARRKKIYRPRAQTVQGICDAGKVDRCETFVDVGCGYGIFLQEIQEIQRFRQVIGLEPAPNLADVSRAKGFKVIQKPVEAVRESEVSADFATSFEVIEHVFSPLDFLQSIRQLLRPGGVLMFTTLTISGFDLQVLWSNSKSIFPPHHINFMSVDGMKRLMVRAGFEVVDVTTPGKLDVDIVANALKENPAIEVPRFVQALLRQHPSPATENFQQYLQDNLFSSHIRSLARRTD
jgi:2-polyprenyl-3-methyl-5-hydroxy-6-metoxy-1,4-benzoquinol methylase